MKKYLLYSNGCYLNKIDTKRIEIFFKKNGWTPSAGLRKSDIVIFNTCAYCQEKEDQCISILKKMQKEKTKNQKLIVAGCLPVINKERLLANFQGSYFGPLSINSLADHLPIKYKKIKSIPTAQAILTDENTFSGKAEEAFCIRIAYGCLNRCSFCAVKNVFPKLNSKIRKNILNEFSMGLERGYRTFLLTAEDTSVYGRDIRTNLVELLKDLIRKDGQFSIYLYRLNPEGLLKIGKDFLRVLESKKIKYLSIPVNSGSNRILELMNRRYKTDEIKNYIKRIKKLYPFIKLNLDIMVGFPGETESDFRDTQRFVLETAPDNIRVFEFTDRPGTTAKYLGEAIPKNIMRKRSMLLYQTCKLAKHKYLIKKA